MTTNRAEYARKRRREKVANRTVWYVYALIDPRNLRVRYVGFTGDLNGRLSGHIADARNFYCNVPKADWINSLVSHGLRPQIVILEETTKNYARIREAFWYKTLLEAGADLLNSHLGISTKPLNWRENNRA